MGRHDKPSHRVHFAMKRLSRDKWLTPSEVMDIGVRLAKIASPTAWGRLLKYSYADECEVVGMIDGRPPAFHFEKDYGLFMDVASKATPEKRTAAMIKFLKIKLAMRG